jgi:hypothetical protein
VWWLATALLVSQSRVCRLGSLSAFLLDSTRALFTPNHSDRCPPSIVEQVLFDRHTSVLFDVECRVSLCFVLDAVDERTPARANVLLLSLLAEIYANAV